MKLPQIIINPPDWLAVILSALFGLAWLVSVIALKDLVRLLP